MFGSESEFRFDELFISRTDKRGIIQFSNPVFKRVARYDWPELLRKPHRLIRHPAMPRGVFQFFWDVIQAGQSVGTYVVNRAKDGAHYWVFSLVSPIRDGFLSVRLKPSSTLFDAAQRLYAEVLAAEKEHKLSPKDGAALLVRKVVELGFHDYPHFMAEALASEMEARQEKIGRKPYPVIAQLRQVLALGNQLQEECEAISAAYAQSAFVPLNLEVQAARIGREAAPIAVVSSQYDGIARQIQQDIQEFRAAGMNMHERICACLFDVCNSIMQQEMVSFFGQETEETPCDRMAEADFITESAQANFERARMSLAEVAAGFDRFRMVHDEVRKQAMALDVIGITGKIEAVKIKQFPELLGLLDDLGTFKDALKESLARINRISNSLVGHIGDIRQKIG